MTLDIHTSINILIYICTLDAICSTGTDVTGSLPKLMSPTWSNNQFVPRCAMGCAKLLSCSTAWPQKVARVLETQERWYQKRRKHKNKIPLLAKLQVAPEQNRGLTVRTSENATAACLESSHCPRTSPNIQSQMIQARHNFTMGGHIAFSLFCTALRK